MISKSASALSVSTAVTRVPLINKATFPSLSSAVFWSCQALPSSCFYVQMTNVHKNSSTVDIVVQKGFSRKGKFFRPTKTYTINQACTHSFDTISVFVRLNIATCTGKSTRTHRHTLSNLTVTSGSVNSESTLNNLSMFSPEDGNGSHKGCHSLFNPRTRTANYIAHTCSWAQLHVTWIELLILGARQ